MSKNLIVGLIIIVFIVNMGLGSAISVQENGSGLDSVSRYVSNYAPDPDDIYLQSGDGAICASNALTSSDTISYYNEGSALTLNLSDYAGQTINLTFAGFMYQGQTSRTKNMSFYSGNACTVVGTPTLLQSEIYVIYNTGTLISHNFTVDASNPYIRFAYYQAGSDTSNSFAFDYYIIDIISSVPVVVLESPSEAASSTSPSHYFAANFTSSGGKQLQNSSLYIWNSTGSIINTTSFVINGTANSTNVSVRLPYEDNFKWNYYVCDNSSGCGWGTNRTVIYDATFPAVGILYPSNTTYGATVSGLNYSYSDVNSGTCWYSANGGAANSSAIPAGTNFTNISSSAGDNFWTLYCNDSSGNLVTESVSFNVNIPVIGLEILYPTASVNVTQNEFFQVQARVSCSNNDCGEINVSLDPISGAGTNYTAYNSSESNGDDYAWEDIGEDGTLVSFSSNDDGSATASIGFDFPFYGVNYSTVYLSSNGRVHFTTTSASNTRVSIPSSSYKLIAPVNNDMYVRSLTKVYYKNESNPNRMVIQYNNLSYYSYSSSYISYQVILYEDGKSKIQYHQNNTPYYASYNTGLNYDSSNHLMMGTDAPDQYKGMALTFLPPGYSTATAKGGLISMDNSSVPFYTTTQNPYNISLNEGDSEVITWWVNATGDLNSTYEFFVYANKTSDFLIGNVSPVWNVTISTESSCIPVWQNTSWTGWSDQTSCLANNTILQNRSLTQYDIGECANPNVTFWDYQEIECDFCTPFLTNTSWSDWVNQTSCEVTDSQLQNRSLAQYDQNFCGEIGNVTFLDYQNISCNYCSYSIVNTSWSSWANVSCLYDDTRNQLRSLTEYDENYSSCYEITEIESDLWNSGGNRTYNEYQNILFCNYSIDGDDDSDGVLNGEDKLVGNGSNINQTGFTNLNLTIGGNSSVNNSIGEEVVMIYDSMIPVINFTHNFSQSILNLSKVKIIKEDNFLIVNFSEQLQGNKTLSLSDNSFVGLCVKDAEVASVDEISSSCEGDNETDFTDCIGNSTGVYRNGLMCVDSGSIIRIENLQHSAIKGTPAVPVSPSTGGSSSGGGTSRRNNILSCVPSWVCDSWSFCSFNNTQKRDCADLNMCNNESGRPEESRECPNILFDSLVSLKSKRVYPWNNLVFDVNLKEVTQFELVDVKVVYKILKNQNIVYEESETKAIKEDLAYTKEISELDLSPGEYSLFVILEYGVDQISSSEQNFIAVGSTSIIVYLVIFILLIMLVFVIFNWYKSRKHEEEVENKLKRIEEKLDGCKSRKESGGWWSSKVESVRLRSLEKRKSKLLDSDEVLGELVEVETLPLSKKEEERHGDEPSSSGEGSLKKIFFEEMRFFWQRVVIFFRRTKKKADIVEKKVKVYTDKAVGASMVKISESEKDFKKFGVKLEKSVEEIIADVLAYCKKMKFKNEKGRESKESRKKISNNRNDVARKQIIDRVEGRVKETMDKIATGKLKDSDDLIDEVRE